MSSDDSSLTDSSGDEIPVKKAKVQEQKKGKTAQPAQVIKEKKKVESSDDDEEEISSSKTKKKATTTGKRTKESSESSENEDELEEEEIDSKKKKTNREKDNQGHEMIPIGNNRFISVDRFKGKILVGIREYFQKDGKWFPGKKGISLTQDQYNAFLKALPDVKDMLSSA